MATIGFHATHEQVDPRSLLDAVRMAKTAGFGPGIYLHHVGVEQRDFIEASGKHELFALAGR